LTHRTVLTLFAVTLLVGCARPRTQAPDALLLTIDTLRGDRWGCLGDPQARTPHVDRLARRGNLAFEGRVSAPITLPSHASIMTGLPPGVHGVRDNGVFRLDPEAGTTLAERLSAAGWSTAAFVSAFPLLAGFGLDRGFDHYDSALGSRDDSLGGMRQRTAAQTLDRLEHWFSSAKAPPPSTEAPLFLWVHFFDPHADYTAPAPWPAIYPEDPYRAEVAFTDDQTGRLLFVLRRERTRELQVVVTSDHGEGLFDHGESTHGALLHASTIRVPIVASPGDRRTPGLLGAPLSVQRVPATVLSLLGQDPELNRGSAPPLGAPPGAVHAETLYPWFNFGWAGLRSREDEGWSSATSPRIIRRSSSP
jgi:arylsulfatase A-like enzyme